MRLICTSCGAFNPTGSEYCSKCRAPLQQAPVINEPEPVTTDYRIEPIAPPVPPPPYAGYEKPARDYMKIVIVNVIVWGTIITAVLFLVLWFALGGFGKKSYKGETTGFSFKYPRDFEEFPYLSNEAKSQDPTIIEVFAAENNDYILLFFSSTMNDVLPGEAPRDYIIRNRAEFIEKLSSDPAVVVNTEESKIFGDGCPGIHVSIKGSESSEEGYYSSSYTYEIAVTTDGKNVYFLALGRESARHGNGEPEKQMSDMFENIMSSVKLKMKE